MWTSQHLLAPRRQDNETVPPLDSAGDESVRDEKFDPPAVLEGSKLEYPPVKEPQWLQVVEAVLADPV